MPFAASSASLVTRTAPLCGALLALCACATGPDPQEIAEANAVESKFVAALQAPEQQDGEAEAVGAVGDYWGTGTVASVDDEGRLVYLVPTSLIEREGVDAYADRRGPHERSTGSGPLGHDPYLLYNGLMTPNPVRANRGYRMVLGGPGPQRSERPGATPGPAPRPDVGASSRSSRPARSYSAPAPRSRD